MNQKHLGDALDYWKGGVMALLASILRDVHVIPMFTDEDPGVSWTDARLRLYARILCVPRSHIMNCHVQFRASTRTDYFSSLHLPARVDLLLDPDNGVASEGTGNAKHVRLNELAMLLPVNSARIALVYQHSFRIKNYVETALQRVVNSQCLAGTAAFAYQAGAVSMLFVSRNRPRLMHAHAKLTQMFNGTTRISEIH